MIPAFFALHLILSLDIVEVFRLRLDTSLFLRLPFLSATTRLDKYNINIQLSEKRKTNLPKNTK